MPLLFFILWIILNGRITLEIVLFGILITAVMTLFSVKVMGHDLSVDRQVMRNFPLLIRYVGVLIYEIVKAAVTVIKVALNPNDKPDPVIVEFHSGLSSDFQNVLLANSITLTPGTFTLEQKDDYFVVHCLKREYADGMENSSFVKLLRQIH